MSLLSRLKQKLGIRIETQTDRIDEIEPIHKPSFSIGDSLGDIKVGVMRLKTQLERIEGSMLAKEYFDQSVGDRDRSDLIIDKLDKASPPHEKGSPFTGLLARNATFLDSGS